MRMVSVNMLKPEMRLAFPVYCKNALVIKAGKDNMARYIPNLTNMGIHFVYVEDKQSDGIEISDALSGETRYGGKKALKKIVEQYSDFSTITMSSINDSIEHIISDILHNRDIQISLNDIGTVDEYTYVHSVDVCVYSLLIGRELGYNKTTMNKLAMGAILHDIGKTVLERDIQFKKGALTEDEYVYMKRHADFGYEILKMNTSMPEASRRIALNHHERLDGSGYPNGLGGNQLDEFARITAIADVFDALISDRCYKRKWSVNQAVDYMIEYSDSLFSAELVQLFIQQIAIYPNGSMVLMSDNSIGIVKEQNKNVPLRPIVRLIVDRKGQEIESPHEIDLMENLAITIIKSELELEREGSLL